VSVHKAVTIDAAYPPPACPPGIAGVLGYIGGPLVTHTWPTAAWLPFAHVRQFPLYVGDLGRDPAPQASQAVDRMFALGWSPWLGGAARRALIIDLETGADPAWYERFAAVVLRGGYVPVVYGSASTVLGNAASDVLVAEWDNMPDIPPGQTIRGIQYKSDVPLENTKVDYSVIDDWLLARGGIGPRRQSAVFR